MSSVRWLSSNDAPDAFPPPGQALAEPNGLLAAGGDLSAERLLSAYPRGIFPWYEEGQPILWWSPDPRAVMRPEEIKISRTLRRILRRDDLSISADAAFEAVLGGCAEPRRYGGGTWITGEMIQAYQRLHDLGWAHSFEAWREGALVGGLYGVCIGRVFFGESMFSRESDASKVALIKAVTYLRERGCELIDCQVWSAHLQSLGAIRMPREAFLDSLDRLCEPPGTPGSWRESFEEFSA